MSETQDETVMTPAESADAWYCPACGQRFPEPGVHDVGHAPVELLPLGVIAHDTAAGAVPAAGAAPQTGPNAAVETTIAEAPAATQEAAGGPAGAAKAAMLAALTTAQEHVQHALEALARL